MAKIEGVDPTAQTIIEGLQPYRRGAAYIDDPLWRLHELGRIDKHRLLHPIAASFWGITLDYEKCINVWQMEGDITCYGGVIENRAVIARVPITPVDARKEVHVEALATLDIAFDRTTPVAAEESISDILGGIYNYILTKVLPPLNPFL